jgi:N-acetylglucosamine-6-phosphate deacetylase
VFAMAENQTHKHDGRLALTNGQIILPQAITKGKAVIVDKGVIVNICDEGAVESAIERVDVGGRFIAPGLIDIHTHGALGHSFSDATEGAFSTITAEHIRRGVTSLLPTLSTAPIASLVEALELIREWVHYPRGGARVLGAHVEGPYFSPAQCGAQDPSNMLTPDDGTVDQLLEYYDIIRIMTYAPELPGALELTRRLTELNIVPAAGHSSAQETHMDAAVEAGLQHIIHIWSGQSMTVREGPWRKPGLLEVSLAWDNLTVEMITDNKHLPRTLMRLAYKCVGPNRLCIISDATAGAGLPEGSRFRLNDVEHEVKDGVGMMLDRTSFAGSTSLLNEMIPVLTNVVGVPLVEAVRMSSLNPARVIGVDDRKGSIDMHKDADIAIFNDDFTAWRTMVDGRWAYVS